MRPRNLRRGDAAGTARAVRPDLRSMSGTGSSPGQCPPEARGRADLRATVGLTAIYNLLTAYAVTESRQARPLHWSAIWTARVAGGVLFVSWHGSPSGSQSARCAVPPSSWRAGECGVAAHADKCSAPRFEQVAPSALSHYAQSTETGAAIRRSPSGNTYGPVCRIIPAAKASPTSSRSQARWRAS